MDKLKELVEGVDTHKKILEYMIKSYEERGGGYSQKESLRTAIKAFDFLTTISEAEGLPEKGCEYTKSEKHEGKDCNNCGLSYNCADVITNKAIDLFTPLLHKKDIEIAELKEENKELESELTALYVHHTAVDMDRADFEKENTALKEAHKRVIAEYTKDLAKLDKGRIEVILKNSSVFKESEDIGGIELEADEVTLAFFRKYLDMPKGTVESMCREVIALKAKLDADRIEGILANPKHWCPSKAKQWKRMADAIIKEDK